jgi:hypothetical protein
LRNDFVPRRAFRGAFLFDRFVSLFARIISLFARAGNCRSDWRNINGLLAQDASQNRLWNGFS